MIEIWEKTTLWSHLRDNFEKIMKTVSNAVIMNQKGDFKLRKTYDMVDAVKLLMAILIVALHCQAVGLNILGRLGVPFFFIASSFFLFKKYFSVSIDDQKVVVKRYLLRIFYLYLAWQIIYLPNAVSMCIAEYKVGGELAFNNN